MTLDEILEYLLTSVPDEYDTSVGSFFYDLLYPVAIQIYFLMKKIDSLSTNTFALTATGEYLDRKVAEQGLTRKTATYATGVLRLTGEKGSIVHAGSKTASENILFAVDETVTIPEMGYVDVKATCTTAGIIGNVRKGKINRYPLTLPGMTAVENITDFTGGYDAESDDDLRERYLEKVSRPNVSGNKYHYIEWAKAVNGVGNVQVAPLWDGPGTVKVIIVDANNQPADTELINKVRTNIEENKPIGASVTVTSAESLSVDVSVKLVLSDDIDIRDTIEKQLKQYLSDITMNKTYISYAKIGGIILSVSGVDDYTDLTVNGGTENITLTESVVPVLGDVVIT